MTGNKSILNLVYAATLFIITLTGFAQMPIFKRYYIADIPGLGWLAQFYVTHTIHYLAAGVLLYLAAYAIITFGLERKQGLRITRLGSARALLLLGLIITGILLVIRNFPGTPFTPVTVMVVDILHLLLCVGLLGISFVSLVRKEPWVRIGRSGS